MNTSHQLTRRSFIKSTGGFVLAAGVLEAPVSVAAKAAGWPVSCRDSHLKATGKPDCWSAMKELGVGAVEVLVNEDLLCPNLYHPSRKYSLATAEGLQTLKDDLAANGAAITAFCMSNRLDERLERELAWAKAVVKATQQMNVNAIRIDVVPRAIQGDQFLPFAIQACKQLCGFVAGTPIRYGIENHGEITNDPVFLEKLFDGVGSTQLGLTLDACNYYWFGFPLNDLYAIYEKFASRTFHTHCKTIRYPEDRRNSRRPIGWEYDQYTCPLYEGDIDYKKVVRILRKANYRGDLCLENECLGHFPKDQHAEVLKKEIAMLKDLAVSVV